MKYKKTKSLLSLVVSTITSIGVLLSISSIAFADSTAEADANRGAILWAETCNRCHNMRSPSDLNDEQWIASVFHMRVRAGLTGQQTRDILKFLQNSNGVSNRLDFSSSASIENSSPVVAESVDGKSIYEANCVACHGTGGQGVLPGVPDFTAADGPLFKVDEQLLNSIINGVQSPGSPMPMPARGGNSQLSDADLVATLEYLKAEFKP